MASVLVAWRQAVCTLGQGLSDAHSSLVESLPPDGFGVQEGARGVLHLWLAGCVGQYCRCGLRRHLFALSGPSMLCRLLPTRRPRDFRASACRPHVNAAPRRPVRHRSRAPRRGLGPLGHPREQGAQRAQLPRLQHDPPPQKPHLAGALRPRAPPPPRSHPPHRSPPHARSGQSGAQERALLHGALHLRVPPPRASAHTLAPRTSSRAVQRTGSYSSESDADIQLPLPSVRHACRGQGYAVPARQGRDAGGGGYLRARCRIAAVGQPSHAPRQSPRVAGSQALPP
mmetsp:Transcript_49538/g.117569  ORF Transcript_49538/g.117569 Transcript_49538/m.117569 type:complete len:285 (+) Transcript_49538:178-1032(+)